MATLLGRLMEFVGKEEQYVPAMPPPSTRCHVQLAITPFGPRLPKFQAFHTSVLVNGIEFSFSGAGISRASGTQSHAAISRNCVDTIIIDFGLHMVGMEQFDVAMRPHFQRGTYDLLRKNCNSFSDCALFCLTGSRLEKKYRFLESIGRAADKYTSFVQAISGGGYKPNPLARDFSSDAVVLALGGARQPGGCGGGRQLARAPLVARA